MARFNNRANCFNKWIKQMCRVAVVSSNCTCTCCPARQQSYGMPIQEKPNNSFPSIQVQKAAFLVSLVFSSLAFDLADVHLTISHSSSTRCGLAEQQYVRLL